MLGRTASTQALVARAMSHVAFPGEGTDDTLARVCAASGHMVTPRQLLAAGVPTADVELMVARAGGTDGLGRFSLAEFEQLGLVRQQSAELRQELGLGGGAMDLNSALGAARPNLVLRAGPRAAGGPTSAGEWSFVSAAACRGCSCGSTSTCSSRARRCNSNLLGEGAGCIGVFRLTSPLTGQSFAVKMIERFEPGSPEGISLDRELQILNTLVHPSVTQLYTVVADTYLWVTRASSRRVRVYLLVLSLCEQGELFDQVAAGRTADENIAREYFCKVLDALDYCHGAGVMHRDLKLENVLVENASTREIRITDFGASRLCSLESFNKGQYTAVAKGTVAYMAPEMAVGDGRYDASAVDVWSLGVMLFVMVAQAYPFGCDQGSSTPAGGYIWTFQNPHFAMHFAPDYGSNLCMHFHWSR